MKHRKALLVILQYYLINILSSFIHFYTKLRLLIVVMWFVGRSAAVPLALRETLSPGSTTETLAVPT